jgi:HEAT repeat protein
MPLLDLPFGWTWLLVIGWMGYRLLISLMLGAREAANLGRREFKGMFFFHLLGSAIVWAIFGAVGWRTIFGQAGPISVVCFGIVTGFVGLAAGFLIDMFLVTQFQHRIAVGIVTNKASTYAELLDLGDSEQRIRGAQAMAFIGPKALFAVPQLLVAWKDRDADLRYHVAVALYCIGADDPAIGAAMQNGLSDTDARVRVVAASLLVKRKQAEADAVLPLLRAGLTMDEDIRNLAADALAELGPAAAPAIPDLIALMGEDFNHNYLARWVLASIGSAAVPALLPLLQSESKKVRATAIDTLAEIGPAAREALPALQDLALKSDKNTRMTIASAIAKIEGNE